MGARKKGSTGARIIASNRKARRDYQILQTLEAGLVLTGAEVKSLRAGRATLKDSYARLEDGEVFLYNMHIAPYDKAHDSVYNPDRRRKLLLNSSEIEKLVGKIAERGLTLVPLDVHFGGPWAKVLLALARGKKTIDKRRDIAERDAKREIERAQRTERRGPGG